MTSWSTHRSGVTKPVVFYGGSIVQGASASRPGMCWPNLVGRMIDVPLVIGQHCYYLDARGPMHAFAPRLIERLKKEDPEFGKWLHLVRLEDMFAPDSDGTVDGGHPNDWGSMHMAKAFSVVIAQALKLPSGSAE